MTTNDGTGDDGTGGDGTGGDSTSAEGTTGDGGTGLAELEALSTEELRTRAFDKAKDAHDVGFFWDLAKHLRASRSLAAEDGSGGGLTGSITELVELGRELTGRDLGEDEPLVRARFLDYLRS